MNGKWRIWGTGRFTIWFLIDILRPIRNIIFFITYKNKLVKSGFTVKDSERVEGILKGKNLLLKTNPNKKSTKQLNDDR